MLRFTLITPERCFMHITVGSSRPVRSRLCNRLTDDYFVCQMFVVGFFNGFDRLINWIRVLEPFFYNQTRD